jgi:arginine/glutamate-rich protein 1
MKKKDEEIGILRNNNTKILDEIKRLKEEKKHGQNHEKTRILDEGTTKRLEEEIYKKVEESLNTDEVKSEMQTIIEEGCQNLINGVAL